MGQVESQPLGSGPNPSSDTPKKEQSFSRTRRHASSAAGENDAASQISGRSSFTTRTARSPLSWAAAGMELVASTTAEVAVTTMNAAFKTASVLASTTEAAANVVANTTTNVAINTANVATQTASLITNATSAGAKTAGDAIAGTASLVVEGFAPSGPTTSPKHVLNGRDTRSRSGDSPNGLSPQSRAAFFATTGGRGVSELMLPEAMGLGTMKSSSSHDNLSDAAGQKVPMRRNVGTRFWCMVGATNTAARKHWVATVTSSKPSAPSAKYLRKILALAWESKGQSVEEFYRFVQMRPITTSPNCALKALITSLRIVREGPPEALSLSISHVGLIDAMGAAWAERVLLDDVPEEPVSAGLAQGATVVGASGNPSSSNRATSPFPQASSTQTMRDDLMEQVLVARLSGLIVQKMHFHSKRTSLNARYESNGESSKESDVTVAGEDEWEHNVQLASSLLTLLGTIEGVSRLALGMGGAEQQAGQEKNESLSLASLSLATLLIEEALSAFDALSALLLALTRSPQRDQDMNLVRSLLTRYHEAYDSMRNYVGVALQYPYVAALNKIPHLDDELDPLSRGGSPLSRLLATTSSSSSSLNISPINQFFSSHASSSVALLSPNASNSKSNMGSGPVPPSLAARPFTRRSILETLEEEEALEDRLGSAQLLASVPDESNTLNATIPMPRSAPTSPLLAKPTGGLGRSQSVDEEFLAMKQNPVEMFNPWEYSSNSVEHARPPSQFCIETEDEDNSESTTPHEELMDEDIDFVEELGSGRPTPVRTKTLGNPFDTGNSSIVLLAEAHRSAFSTISNPFASGHFNPFATNQLATAKQPQQTLNNNNNNPGSPRGAVSPTAAGGGSGANESAIHKQKRQEATRRALEQCERLFEFSGIKLRPEDISISKDMIGRGAFSIVHRGTLVSTGQEVAVKELLIDGWGRSPETILDFRAEVAVMKAVHHPNVLQLIGASTTPNLRLISEFCHRGNLFDLLYNDRSTNPSASKVLNWPLRLRMALGEARGMHFLHTAFPAPLIHRDLKSLNLLLSKNWTLKVSDFGLSRFRRRGVNDGPCGTTQWMAPEVILGKDYDERADVYSFGINLWELCSRRVPWEGRNDVKQVVVNGERLKVDGDTLDANCPPELIDLIKRCWSADPSERPDFGEIVTELKSIALRLRD